MGVTQFSLEPREYPALLSLVIPLYNEEPMVALLRARLEQFVQTFPGAYEIILVNDGSSDRTIELLWDWAARTPRVKVIALARNFGHQIAATAGLDYAEGDAVVLMDADLQDPPELIHQMIDEYRKGYDVVYAQRIEREGESIFKRWTAWAFYRGMRRLVYKDLPPDAGDFRLISRQCLVALRGMRETHRFLRGMVAWVGFPQKAVQFVRPPRAAGQTKYPLRKMLLFAWTAALSFSPLPLRFLFGLGSIIAGLGLLGGFYAVAAIIAGLPIVRGWASIMVLISLVGGSIMMSIGILGEYVARIFDESKGRPLYVVYRTRNFDTSVYEPKHKEAVAGSRHQSG